LLTFPGYAVVSATRMLAFKMSSKLSQLVISNIRNLRASDIQLGPKFNVFVGLNGSGKTSILEAVHLLGLGRSFRARSIQQVIKRGNDQCVVRGMLRDAESLEHSGVWLGVAKGADGSSQYKIGEATEKSPAELSRALPVQLIDVNSHLLLEGGPEKRRKFIDWGVFHMEHSFLLEWRGFQRALEQRNAALKQRRAPEQAWNEAFAKHAEQVTSRRKSYVLQFKEVFLPFLREKLAVESVSVAYRCGWDEDRSLLDQLDESLGRDIACGFTTCGPHRADLEVLIDGEPAKSVLSRGQIKIFVCIMLLARSKLLLQPQDNVFLIDDLHAELDRNSSRALIEAINGLGGQVFVTGIEAELLQESLQGFDSRMFHVEQGTIVERV